MRLVSCRVIASFVKISKTRISVAMSSTEGTYRKIICQIIEVVDAIVSWFLAARGSLAKPEGADAPKLKLYNSLTRQKVIVAVIVSASCLCDDPLPIVHIAAILPLSRRSIGVSLCPEHRIVLTYIACLSASLEHQD